MIQRRTHAPNHARRGHFRQNRVYLRNRRTCYFVDPTIVETQRTCAFRSSLDSPDASPSPANRERGSREHRENAFVTVQVAAEKSRACVCACTCAGITLFGRKRRRFLINGPPPPPRAYAAYDRNDQLIMRPLIIAANLVFLFHAAWNFHGHAAESITLAYVSPGNLVSRQIAERARGCRDRRRAINGVRYRCDDRERGSSPSNREFFRSRRFLRFGLISPAADNCIPPAQCTGSSGREVFSWDLLIKKINFQDRFEHLNYKEIAFLPSPRPRP